MRHDSYLDPSSNTVKISAAMAKAIGADLLSVTEAQAFPQPSWDMVGLGSGIFFGAHHKSLLRFATHWLRPPKRS